MKTGKTQNLFWKPKTVAFLISIPLTQNYIHIFLLKQQQQKILTERKYREILDIVFFFKLGHFLVLSFLSTILQADTVTVSA